MRYGTQIARRARGATVATVCCLALIVGSLSPATAQVSEDERYLFSDLAEKVMPSVVTVYVKRNLAAGMSDEQRERMEQFRRFFGDDEDFFRMFPGMPPNDEEDPFLATTSGSGVVISEDGYILTNRHVITMAREQDPVDFEDLTVAFADGTEMNGDSVKFVHSDALTDLAVIKVDKSGLDPIEWGDSDALRIGERVAAIGSPLDLKLTVTQGIVSAKKRELGLGITDLIQSDAVINPGSSGGALVNMEGELVGINRLISTNTGRWQGYGFAIPSNDAKLYADSVIQTGTFETGFIGVQMLNEFRASGMLEAMGIDKDRKGVLVESVTEGSPAEKAGVESGDYIVEADGTKIEDNLDLLKHVARKKVGSEVELKILRPRTSGEPEELTKTLTLASRSQFLAAKPEQTIELPRDAQEPAASVYPLGLKVEPSTDNGKTGLLVQAVRPDSPAAAAGLRQGDLLLKLNGRELKTIEDLEQAVEAQPEDRPHWVQYMREGELILESIKQR